MSPNTHVLSNDRDRLPQLIAELALYPQEKWEEHMIGKGETTHGTNTVLWEIFKEIDEARWLKETTIFLFGRTERLRQLTKSGATISEFAYLPVPGLKNGTRIKHPCETKSRLRTQAILTDAPGLRSRELAWLINYKTSIRETNFIAIFTYDPILEIIVRTNATEWEKCTSYWRQAIAAQGILKTGERTSCIHAFTGLHEWMQIIQTGDGEDTPQSWRRHPVSTTEANHAAEVGLDIYYSNSVVAHVWSTLEKQRGKERARALLQQNLCKKVILFDPLYGKNQGLKKEDKTSPPDFLDPGDTEREKTAKSFWEGTIVHAFESGASDIHIEPIQVVGKKGCDLIISIRKDGQLNFHTRIPDDICQDFVRFALETSGVIKAENKRPQDGRRGWIHPRTGQTIDLRISVTPCGAPIQKIVMRLLDTTKLKRGIADIGLEDWEVQIWDKGLKLNQSLTLVSGPTNSGKSTTLYAALLTIFQRDNRRSFSTIEDPVEYRLPFRSTQSPVNEEVGATYEKLIRQAMRNDGDTFLIGEIRDEPTASASLQLALTGHQVLSSIHANSATETALRLLELGVDPYILSETLKLVVSQRLIPTACPYCAKELPESEIKALLRRHGGEVLMETWDSKWRTKYRRGPKWVEGEGCPQCNFTGLLGMMAAQEFLIIDAKNKKSLKDGHVDRLAASMVERSLPTMTETAWRLAWLGRTPIGQAGELTDQLKSY